MIEEQDIISPLFEDEKYLSYKVSDDSCHLKKFKRGVVVSKLTKAKLTRPGRVDNSKLPTHWFQKRATAGKSF